MIIKYNNNNIWTDKQSLGPHLPILDLNNKIIDGLIKPKNYQSFFLRFFEIKILEASNFVKCLAVWKLTGTAPSSKLHQGGQGINV